MRPETMRAMVLTAFGSYDTLHYRPDIPVPRRADAVVIGGGIIGTATAYWLSKFGLKTVLVESREGLSTFTTAAPAECFRAQFTEPELAAIAKESIEIFENFAEFAGLKVQ